MKNNFMKKYFPLFILLIFSACKGTQKPVSSEKPVNNNTYTVEYLFEHEGCKVYRFFDQGNYVYFTNCNGEAITKTDSTQTRNLIKSTKN